MPLDSLKFGCVPWTAWNSGRTNVLAKQVLLLSASYLFYISLAWPFFWLLLLSTLVAFVFGIIIERKQRSTTFLILGLIFFIGVLGYFKYRAFFLDPFASKSTQLILPLGISFYVFEAMGYMIDVKRGFPASRKLLEFALFIAFFPKVVLGPIERAAHLLPQLRQPRPVTWESVNSGLFLLLWGVVKKSVVADQLGSITAHHTSPLLTAYVFAFELYFDFSGYTDMAIGGARVFGIDLLPNFNRPYASASIGEFWRRWHMSFSFWLRDYLYIPLGGNRVGTFRRYLNVLIVFLLSGLWHGAGWTFILWGLLHGLMMIFSMITKRLFEWVPRAIKIVVTFHSIALAWILFYSPSIQSAVESYGRLGSGLGISWKLFGLLTVVIMLVEGAEYMRGKLSINWLRWPVSYVLLLALILFGHNQYSFLYVRF